MFYIYILRSQHTQDVDARVLQHNSGKSISTHAGVPWELIHTESFETRSAAILRERKVKTRGIARYLADVQRSEVG